MAQQQKVRPNAAKQKQDVAAKQWEALFPPLNKQYKQTESLILVKKLVAVGISQIVSQRALFDKGGFQKKKLDGVPLHIMNGQEGTDRLIRYLGGINDAVSKKYLREALLLIYVDPNNPDEVVEAYRFGFKYAEDGSELLSVSTSAGGAGLRFKGLLTMRKATVALLRLLHDHLGLLQPLPDNSRVTVKLSYYDDRTPADYEPPGFEACATRFHFSGEVPRQVQLGDVHTEFHGCSLTLRSKLEGDADEFEADDEPHAEQPFVTDSPPLFTPKTTSSRPIDQNRSLSATTRVHKRAPCSDAAEVARTPAPAPSNAAAAAAAASELDRMQLGLVRR